MIKELRKQKPLIKFFFSYQRKYLALAMGAGVMLLLNVLLGLPMPLVTRYLIDKVIPSGNFQALNMVCLLLLSVLFLGQGSALLYRYLIVKYNARVRIDLERDLYYHIQDLPMYYFSRHPSGYILSRINEVGAVESVMADTFFNMLRNIITMLVGAVLILNFHFKLGLFSMLVLPFFVLSIKVFHKPIKAINKKLKEETAQYTGKLEKNITAIEKIKSSVTEDAVGRRLVERLKSLIRLRIKSQLLSAFAGIVGAFIGAISPFVVLWFGVSEIMRGELSLGTFFAMNAFLGYLYGPARQLTNMGYTISRAMAGLERIYEVFNEKEEDKSGEPIEEITSIAFNNVCFSYNGDDSEPVLDGLNLTLEKGETVAMVGESGQGKSTLVKMIMKFYRPDSGRLSISGRDAADIAVKSLRGKIAYISQKQRILEEQLEEELGHREVTSLLKKFRLDKVIAPTEINQTEFSGGEVQKIELMESVLKEADVLIVDEGTSNIDYNSERIVLEELFSKYRDKIIIFIAHRLSSVTDFQRIVVIDKGRVAEEGGHHQLMDKKGKYHFLWGMLEESEETHDDLSA